MRSFRSSYNLWKEMEAPARRRLAAAVFMTFAVLGPLTALTDPVIDGRTWVLFVMQTIISGSFAASIILFGRKPAVLIAALLTLLVCTALIPVAQTIIAGPSRATIERPSALSIDLSASGAQRAYISMAAVAFIALGYWLFIVVINREGQHRLRLQAEVAIAKRIQQSLLPTVPFQSRLCSVDGKTVTASEVAGDFFDVIALPDESIVVIVADVTGHGTGAGMVSVMTKSALHAHLTEAHSPSHLLGKLNRTLTDLTEKNMFVSMACLFFDAGTKMVHMTTAGHPGIIRAGDAACEVLRTPGLPLGVKQSIEFIEVDRPLIPGDIYIIYTDGITETVNRRDEEYGVDRFMSDVMETRRNATTQISSLFEKVRKFALDQEPRDDMTLVRVEVR
ncbi:MAG: PP2C family protein-serine/threonine phosphatase [Bacteroidota bacterium]